MSVIGEVVESSTQGFVAGTHTVGEAPPFGSFVRTDSDPVVYGIVYEIKTDSKEPGRKPTPHGMSIEELRREQPQIFELLKTEFHVLTFAHSNNKKQIYSLPPFPPPIHTFVYACDKKEIRTLSNEDFFLRTIISSPQVPVDDLIISSLHQAAKVQGSGRDYFVGMGKSLTRFLRDDYERLSSLLRRLG